MSPLTSVIIDDTSDDHCREITVHDLLNDDVTRLTGTDHHYRGSVLTILCLVLYASDKSVAESAYENKRYQNKCVQEVIALRNRLSSHLEKLKAEHIGNA